MAIYRQESHNTVDPWSASGTIARELSPKPYTITRMVLVVRCIATTTTATWFNDPYDRLLSRVNLTGNGKSYFDFNSARLAYHLSRMGGFGPRRPVPIADSLTTVEMFFMYVFHFGVAPFRINPATGMLEDNPWDLTGGIPPTGTGNLTLGGAYAANSAMGTNVTITDGDIEVHLFGVQPEPGDAPAMYLPQAVPVWSQQTITPTATSTGLATQSNVPAGDFLHSILLMMTNGTNAPRDDNVLNSLEVFNTLDNRSILRYNISGAVADYQTAEMVSQFGSRLYLGTAPSDNVTTFNDGIASGGTAGTLTINGPAKDSGLVSLPLHQFAKRGHPLYGIDMRGANSGDLRLNYGVNDATGITMDAAYRRYQLNPEHPANAAM